MSERLSLMRFICAGAGAFRVRFRFISVLTLYKTEELFMTGKNRIIYGSKKKGFKFSLELSFNMEICVRFCKGIAVLKMIL